MVIIMALLSALTYGSADFFGGMAARNTPAPSVVLWSQGFGLLVALAAAPLTGAASVSVQDLLWGMAAGIAGASGVGILYRGLAIGLASVVSPTAAVTGAALPVLFAVIAGERPELTTWAGIALALTAILLLSSAGGDRDSSVFKSLRYGVLAGCGFGGFFILIARTGSGSGMWPLVAARTVTIPLFLFVSLFRKNTLRPQKGNLVFVFLAGTLDMGANVFYLLAARTGYMMIAVVLTALYPAATVLLQKSVRGEKLTAHRIVGLILAVAGAALIGTGG